MIKDQIFETVFTIFKLNNGKNNLILSCIIDLFDFIAKVKIFRLIQHLFDLYSDIIKINKFYFKTLIKVFDDYFNNELKVIDNVSGSSSVEKEDQFLQNLDIETKQHRNENYQFKHDIKLKDDKFLSKKHHLHLNDESFQFKNKN